MIKSIYCLFLQLSRLMHFASSWFNWLQGYDSLAFFVAVALLVVQRRWSLGVYARLRLDEIVFARSCTSSADQPACGKCHNETKRA